MAIIPYQNWSGEGAAVKLRTPQAPDWTAKYQLAAQERRAREAERARQQGEKEDAENTRKDYYKTVGGLSSDWFEADIPARNALTAKVYEILDKHNGNFTGEAFEKEFYSAVADIKTAQIISKNRKDNVDKIGTRIQEVGIDEYDNVDILPDIAQGKHVLKMADGSSLEGDVNKVTDLKSYIDFDTQRELALSKVARRFDENVYMNKQLPEIRKGALTKTPITQPDGSVLTVITEDPAEFSAGLKKTWDGKKSLQKEYETRYAANPRGFGSAYEMYEAAYEPLRGENKTTQKFAPASSMYGQGATDENWQKSAGKTSTFKFGNGFLAPSIGNYTITETPVTFNTSEAIDIKTGKKYAGSVTEGTMGQVHIIPINSKTGEPTKSGEPNAEYMPMVVVKTAPKNKWEEGEEILLPVSVGRGAAESKESKEEREALKKRFDWSEDWANRANEGIKERDKGKAAKTIATKIQSTKDPKKFKVTYTDGTSEIITE